MKTFTFAIAILIFLTLSSAWADGDSTNPYEAYWLTNKKALGAYVDLVLTRRPLNDLARLPADSNQPIWECGAIIVWTYAKDSIWNIDGKPFKPLARVERVEADSITINGQPFKHVQADLKDVIRLLDNPKGKIPIHRTHAPVSGQEEVVKKLSQRLRKQLAETNKKRTNQ